MTVEPAATETVTLAVPGVVAAGESRARVGSALAIVTMSPPAGAGAARLPLVVTCRSLPTAMPVRRMAGPVPVVVVVVDVVVDDVVAVVVVVVVVWVVVVVEVVGVVVVVVVGGGVVVVVAGVVVVVVFVVVVAVVTG